MSGKIKSNPRYEVVSFRTTAEQKELLNKVRGLYSISEFVDLLLTIYLKNGGHNDPASMESRACTTSA